MVLLVNIALLKITYVGLGSEVNLSRLVFGSAPSLLGVSQAHPHERKPLSNQWDTHDKCQPGCLVAWRKAVGTNI